MTTNAELSCLDHDRDTRDDRLTWEQRVLIYSDRFEARLPRFSSGSLLCACKAAKNGDAEDAYCHLNNFWHELQGADELAYSLRLWAPLDTVRILVRELQEVTRATAHALRKARHA